MFKVFFTAKADKELARLASTDIKRILEKLPLLSSPFTSNLDIKKLINQPDFYRLRVGKMRIIFEVDTVKKEIWVRKIGYRGGIYQL